MTDKTILEQALLQIQTLEEAVKANAKGIIASTMKRELSDILKESMEEEDDEETPTPEDEEDTDDVSDEDNTSDEDDDTNLDNEPSKGINGMDSEDDTDDEDTEEPTNNFGADDFNSDDEEGSKEDNVLDMTKASHDEVLKVFKAMKPEDGIVVKKDGNKIEFNDGESDYIIKLDDIEDTDDTDNTEDDTDEGGFGLSESKFGPFDKKVKGKRTGDVAEGENSPFEKKVKGKRTGDVAEGENSPFEKKIKTNKTTDMAEGENAPFDKKPKLNSKTKSGKSVDMEEGLHDEEETVYEIELDGESNEGDQTESARTKGNGYHGGIASKKKYYAGNKRDELQEEVTKLRKQNGEYKQALVLFKEKLNEVALFNGNLYNIVTLYTENSTTKQEKLNIMKRFDKVSSITESKNLFEIVNAELKNKKPITETVVNKISSTPSTSSTEVLSEAKAYENPQFKRMKDLMTKIK